MRTAAEKARRERQVLSKFKSLIAAPPVSLIAALPASATFAVRSRAGNTALPAAVYVEGPQGTRAIGSPALVANEFHRLGYIERGQSVELDNTIDLYVDVGLGVYKKIATGA